MSGQWTGSPAPHKTCFMVELLDRRGWEYVHAERIRIDGGAAVFTNGGMSVLEIVAVYGPHGYQYVSRLDDAGCERLHQRDND